MSREVAFLVYCWSGTVILRGLSGADVARLFDEHGVYRYIIKYFESLHTMGDHCMVQNIDDYISGSSD